MLFRSSNLKSRFFLAMTLFGLLITEMPWNLQEYTGNMGVKNAKYWPKYIGSKRTLLGKAYGIKWGAFGNILGNALGTWWTCWEHLGTWCEHSGDLMGTHWEPKIFKKTNSPHPPQKKKTGSIAASAHLAGQNFYSQLLVFIAFFRLA
jgi:hypothetical protein